MFKKYRTLFAKSNLLQIVSIFLIFTVLSNVIYIPCYFYIRNVNQKNTIDHQQYQLDSGMQIFNASMDTLFNLSNIIGSNTNYSSNYYSRADFDNLQLDKLRETVKECFSPFDFVTESGLTMEDSILFTKKRIYYDKDLLSWSNYFSCDRKGYLSEFSGSYCVLPSARFSTVDHTDYDAITIAWRWKKISNMYFFTHYSLDTLFSLFADNELLACGYLAVYAGDTLLAENRKLLTEDYITLTSKGNNQLNIHVVLQIPSSYIEQDLAGMTHLVQVFITIVLLAALLWILVFSFILWQPFRHISNALYSTGHIQDSPSNKNFTDTVVQGISTLGSQVSDYKQIVETQRERSRIHIFEKTLYRGLYSEESLKTFNTAFPDFPEKWQLAMAQYASDDSTVTADMIQPLLIQYLEAEFSNLFFLPHDQDTLLILVPLEAEENTMLRLNELRSRIEQQHSFYISFSFSGIYESPASLAEAFQDFEYGEFSVLPQTKTASVSMQQLQTIYYALQSGDPKAATAALKASTAKIIANNDLFAAKHSYRMLGYVLVSLKLENNYLTDIPIPPFRNDNIRRFFEEDLPQCFSSITEQFRQRNAEQTERLEQSILDFIQTNLANQQLSVTLVAEQFHISAPTLQKRMNAVCGKTFSAYVETTRMEKAQLLLRETTDTVQEIAEAVGYINANSFFKAYKRCFGEPPLSYRNRNS